MRFRRVEVAFFVLLGVGCRTTYGDESGTTGDVDPLETCKTCQSDQCAVNEMACQNDPACQGCVERPFAFDCFGNENFRKLAACSCFDCATDCDHMCPAGQGACQACGLQSCITETMACTASASCAPCLSDSTVAGCEADPEFQVFLSCACDNCGQECVWSCPDAVTACSTCAIGACSEQYGACLQDTVCAACADNPAAEGCEDDPLTIAARECVCAACDETCGIIFRCDG